MTSPLAFGALVVLLACPEARASGEATGSPALAAGYELAARGNLRGARDSFQLALDDAAAAHAAPSLAAAAYALARMGAADEGTLERRAYLALSMAQDGGTVADAQGALAALRVASGDLDEARLLLEDALDATTDEDIVTDLARDLAAVLIAQGHEAEAQAALTTAVRTPAGAPASARSRSRQVAAIRQLATLLSGRTDRGTETGTEGPAGAVQGGASWR